MGLLLALLALVSGDSAADLTAGQLIAKVEGARRTSGFRVRARLIRTTAGQSKPEVKQLLIKGRRQGEAAQVLYQVLWPKALEGQALLVETSEEGKVGGFLFVPPAAPVPLTRRQMAEPLFGTDVSVEDVVEDFWRWPSQELVGEVVAAGYPCRILESRPGPGAATAYSLVRSWIAPGIALPLRVDKFGKDGLLAKRFVAAKILKQSGGTWTAAILVVTTPDGRSRTVLEGTRSERGLSLPAEQFAPEAIQHPAHAP